MRIDIKSSIRSTSTFLLLLNRRTTVKNSVMLTIYFGKKSMKFCTVGPLCFVLLTYERKQFRRREHREKHLQPSHSGVLGGVGDRSVAPASMAPHAPGSTSGASLGCLHKSGELFCLFVCFFSYYVWYFFFG